uniref:Small ribosomal subunit protein mS25 n=2 Tax=Equus TaxID=9789 RepID=A0A9L0J3M3_EQUAS
MLRQPGLQLPGCPAACAARRETAPVSLRGKWKPTQRSGRARSASAAAAAGLVSSLLGPRPALPAAAMPMKGRFPIRRTLQYLGQGDVVFKDSVKVMTVNYNTHGELGEGARKFVFFNIPQIQYKNPWVQIMMFKNMTPSPFLRFYLDSGEQVLVDVETKSNKEIMEHIKKILGKNEETLKKEEQEKKQLSHPAHFGPRKYCLRECICEVEGQVPCPGLVPLPKEMTGKYKATLRAGAQD